MIASRSHLIRPFLFSLLVVSALSSKFLHLFQHVDSVPRSQLLIFLPTFLTQELLLFVAVWFLLHRTSGVKYAVAATVSGIVACITLSAASSQIGFYFVTGSEIRWDAAKSVGNDPEGRKLMLSGLRPVLVSTFALMTLSYLLTPYLCNIMTRWLTALARRPDQEDPSMELPGANPKRRFQVGGPVRLWTGVAAIGTVALWLVRPAVPYRHMSGALPFTMLQAFGSQTLVLAEPDGHKFPFQELIDGQFWERPRGYYKGWTPGAKGRPFANAYFESRPTWASEDMPPGFLRWTETKIRELNANWNGTEEKLVRLYNPISDPLKISNMELGLLEPLEQALKDHNVSIAHVVLVMMESTRKDMFPFKSGSFIHEKILDSYSAKDVDAIRKVNQSLSRLTPIAEQLTGESSEFAKSSGGAAADGLWKDSAEPGMGGINVGGVWTGSSLSFKSAVVDHCGVGPLPVDFMGEVNADIYQPCIMQVFDLFNQMKSKESGYTGTSQKMQDRKWKSVFAQSITGQYDSQDILNKRMGFDEAIYREEIYKNDAKHYHKGMEKINYFGYPETEIQPYLQDVINNAVQNNTRLFLSHFTSTTHHPWNTPSDYEDKDYFSGEGLIAGHEDMNKYLNTIRFVDTWLGDMMKLLDDAGIANETLVVLVGDHGQAFHEDAPVSGTYENGHISNFRVPLVFRHPKLPRIQVNANATAMSIVPTILDLLASTGSLNKKDSEIAQELVNEYEGQSLIRPYRATHNGRQAWNFGIINAGGTMLSVGSAAVPYRLVLPLTEDFEYHFSDLERDPEEQNIVSNWDLDGLMYKVRWSHGQEAADWVADADQIGRWWVEERKRLWNHREDS